MLIHLVRVDYTYSDRYIVTASVRADRSSCFGANNRYGYFPSGAVAWRIDREAFFARGTALNRLKLRAGYGAVGNDKIGFYPSVPTVTTNFNPVFGR